MAGTIPYAFDPNQSIWVIVECTDSIPSVPSVREGTVIRFRGSVIVTETSTLYDIRLKGDSSTTEFSETDVFVDVITALAEYQIRITA